MELRGDFWRRLWAKADEDRWHSLPCHLLDVAATAEKLWDRLPAASKCVPLGLHEDSEVCRRVTVFLAAAHDVGKANPYFQAKNSRQAERCGIQGGLTEPKPHGYASGCFLKDWFKERWGWDAVAASNVARAVGGHHGEFFTDYRTKCLQLHEQPWTELGPSLLDAIAEVLGVPKIARPEPLNPFLAWLAGFVCVADWLGSNEDMTIFCQDPGDLRAYLEDARTRAATLFDRIEWPQPTGSPARQVAELVPRGRAPNELQNRAERVAREGFGLAIIEAPTGEGKTEAAFALAEPGRAQGGGLSFLLPTMATANGILARVEGFLGERARLAHSHAWLVAPMPNSDDDAMRAEAEDWFAGSKRALLEKYGVGTIDQALMGALRVRHGFVRLFALAGKTVVVDEVHAYDVYMSDLLEVLLGWLRVLGCQVVLLSATLPRSRREALLRAWGTEAGDQAPYPCITWTDGVQVRSETFEVALRKPLSIQPTKCDESEEPWRLGAERILACVERDGGIGALVLNTVGGAQQAYAWLKERMHGSDVDVMIFHARYTAEDRQAKEEAVCCRFGKEAPRAGRTILVATQVVEQSLDLDFDHMVSELAPIDLLIQRAGRLHRHPRRADGALCSPGESDERPNPVFEVVIPVGEPGSVYASDVLIRTEAYLGEGIVLSEPGHVADAVEAVYGDMQPEQAREEWLKRLERALEKEDAKRAQNKSLAQEVAIPSGIGGDLITRYPAHLEEDTGRISAINAKTRIEDLPSITLVLLPHGAIPPPKKLNVATRRRVAQLSIRISASAQRCQDLRELSPPTGWAHISQILGCHVISLDKLGSFSTQSGTYVYNPQIGLCYGEVDGTLSS